MKKLLILVAAVIVAYAGVTLAEFSDADDAPGGMVIGWLLVAGAVGYAIKALLPTDTADPAG